MKEEFAPEIGRVALSKAGRDKGRQFLVVRCDGNYVYLVDGELRKLDKPKKKKCMHLRFRPIVASDIAQKLQKGENVYDSDIRKALAEVVD